MLLLALCLALVGCGSAPSGATASQTPLPSASTATMPSRSHVFIIVMENRSLQEAMAGSYVRQLASTYALATNYHAVAHPSLPNYLALTAGTTFGITDDDYHRLPETGIGHELTRYGISWRAYMQSMTGTCLDSPYPYAVKHDPFAYYGGRCPANVVPLSRLADDLSGDTPRFVWITPNLCDDGHDCSTAVADQFLAGLVPSILNSAAFRQRGLLIITWDEGAGNDPTNLVPAIIAAPDLRRHTTSLYHDHYSTLATIEDALGVPRLGQAATAAPFAELFH
jgi:phospholipase C